VGGGRKTAHRSLQKSFHSPRGLRLERFCAKAGELSVNFVHWFFLNLKIIIIIIIFYFILFYFKINLYNNNNNNNLILIIILI